MDQHRLRLVVEDDGRGVDWDAVRTSAIRRGLLPARRPDEDDLNALHALLFTPGFTTALPSELVGDGSGLAKVAAAAESLRGSVVLESEPGQGTRVIITVPTSRSLQDVVLVRAAGQIWGLPEIAVLDTLPLPRGQAAAPGRAALIWQEGAAAPGALRRGGGPGRGGARDPGGGGRPRRRARWACWWPPRSGAARWRPANWAPCSTALPT